MTAPARDWIIVHARVRPSEHAALVLSAEARGTSISAEVRARILHPSAEAGPCALVCHEESLKGKGKGDTERAKRAASAPRRKRAKASAP